MGSSQRPLRILQICNKPPYPLVDGGCIAMFALTKGLLMNKQEMKILSAYSFKHPILPITYEKLEKAKIEAVFLDLKPHFLSMFFNLFRSHSYILQRFITSDFSSALQKILCDQTFDIVQIESLFMAPYIPLIRKYSRAKICVRAHNVEHSIWEKLLQREKLPWKRKYYSILAKRLRQEEIFWLNQADAVLTITEKDTLSFSTLGVNKPLHYVPFGVFDTLMPTEVLPEFPSLFYLGAMNWLPNEEGIRWFLKEVWPSIHVLFPEMKFYIAGRQIPHWLTNADFPQVIVMGEVEDAKMFMASKSIMVVPLFSGSGVRIKIIEGMVAGKLVITTPLGAQGIDCRDGVHIRLANTAQEFVEAIRLAVNSEDKTKEMGQMARKLILQMHDNEKIVKDLVKYYRCIAGFSNGNEGSI
ncbi:MAG: glycosyltransferase family 4 protein [Bacteroidales bacterium]